MASIEQRIDALEDAAAIEKIKTRLVGAIDHAVRGDEAVDAVRPSITAGYTWTSAPFEDVQGAAGFVDLVCRYAERVSFSLQFLSGAIVDLAQEEGRASGQWTVWQPFTLEHEAWVLAGRSHDSFVRSDDGWKVTKTLLEVDILAPWTEAWGTSLISPKWNW